MLQNVVIYIYFCNNWVFYKLYLLGGAELHLPLRPAVGGQLVAPGPAGEGGGRRLLYDRQILQYMCNRCNADIVRQSNNWMTSQMF
jgi:hypothetical protein